MTRSRAYTGQATRTWRFVSRRPAAHLPHINMRTARMPSPYHSKFVCACQPHAHSTVQHAVSTAHMILTSVITPLSPMRSKSQSFRRAYASGSAASVCSKSGGSLCSSSGQTLADKAALLIATSPQAFDARSGSSMGGFSAVAQPKDQASDGVLCEAGKGMSVWMVCPEMR